MIAATKNDVIMAAMLNSGGLTQRERIIKMGWCSATDIFDQVVGALLEPPLDKETVIKSLIDELENGDWDCQQDSKYFNHPLIQKIFREKYPHWFEDDETTA